MSRTHSIPEASVTSAKPTAQKAPEKAYAGQSTAQNVADSTKRAMRRLQQAHTAPKQMQSGPVEKAPPIDMQTTTKDERTFLKAMQHWGSTLKNLVSGSVAPLPEVDHFDFDSYDLGGHLDDIEISPEAASIAPKNAWLALISALGNRQALLRTFRDLHEQERAKVKDEAKRTLLMFRELSLKSASRGKMYGLWGGLFSGLAGLLAPRVIEPILDGTVIGKLHLDGTFLGNLKVDDRMRMQEYKKKALDFIGQLPNLCNTAAQAEMAENQPTEHAGQALLQLLTRKIEGLSGEKSSRTQELQGLQQFGSQYIDALMIRV